MQQAVEELYSKADNIIGSNEVLPVGNINVSEYTVIVPYTGTYP